jgi:hypothetical protein
MIINGTKCAFDILYQVKACAALTAFPRGVRMAGFSQNPLCATYFFLQPKKLGKKSRSPNYVLHPIISDI